MTTTAAPAAAFAPRAATWDKRPDGGLVLRGPALRQDHPVSLGAVLERRGREHPERVFLAQRDDSGGWRRLTYGEALKQVRALGQALLQEVDNHWDSNRNSNNSSNRHNHWGNGSN